MLTKKKTFQVLHAIKNAADIAVKGKPIYLHPEESEELKTVKKFELAQIMAKLETEAKVIKILHTPSWAKETYFDDFEFVGEELRPCFQIQLTKKFQPYFDQIASELPALSEKVEQSATVSKSDNRALWINYTPNRQILLNDLFELSNPDFDSINERIFAILYANPNQKITIEELSKKLHEPCNKDLHAVVRDLGFEKDLRKLFFDVSKAAICFKNPLNQQDFERSGVKTIPIKVK